MLYITLLNKVIRYVDEQPEDAGSQTVRALAKITGKNLRGYVEQFDVRDIGNLRNIIPRAFPKVLRDSPLVIEKNIYGAWRVVPILKNGKPFGMSKYQETHREYV